MPKARAMSIAEHSRILFELGQCAVALRAAQVMLRMSRRYEYRYEHETILRARKRIGDAKLHFRRALAEFNHMTGQKE